MSKKKEFTLPEGVTLSENEQAIVDALIAEFTAINEAIAALGGTEEETEAAIEAEVDKALKKFKVDLDKDDTFKALKKSLEDHVETLKKQGLLIKGLQENPLQPVRRKTLGQMFAEYVAKHPEELAIVKKSQGVFVMNIKTADDILNSTNVTGTIPQAEREPGMTDIAREKRFIMDIIGSSPTSSKSIDYVEKENPDGTAIFVNDATGFAQIDFDLVVSTSTAKDTGAYITVHENMLDDIQFMQGEIDGELMYKIKLSADVGILSGDGSGAKLTGIIVSAAAFSLTSIQVVTPTLWDLISAAMRQVEITGFDEANFIAIHPADYENALGSKDSDGRYVAHPSLSPDGTRLAGVPIDRSTLITAGNVLVGNKMKSNIKILQDIKLDIGYNLTNEFVERLITVRGSMRLHHYIKDNEVSSFVYDSYDDIKAAIQLV